MDVQHECKCVQFYLQRASASLPHAGFFPAKVIQRMDLHEEALHTNGRGGEREAAGQPSETEEHSRCRYTEYIKKKKRSSAHYDAGLNIGFSDISEGMCLRLL